ncbi:hypothetical protein Tco_0949592 [Tanacetum coccineum]
MDPSMTDPSLYLVDPWAASSHFLDVYDMTRWHADVADVHIIESCNANVGVRRMEDDKGKGKIDDLVDALEKGKSKLMVSEKGSKKASVDLVDALDLQNRLKKLSKDFNMLVKAQKTKEAKEAKVVLGLKDFLMFLKLLLLRFVLLLLS